MVPLSEEEFKWFLTEVKKNFSLDLTGYKPHRVKRRTEVLIRKYGLKSFREYMDVLKKDETKRKEFIDKMTINVTEFFRNPEKWWKLRDKYLPELLKNRNFKAWSAGCSSGEEPYSLAILLEELKAPSTVKVKATDIDVGVLNKARQGVYPKRNLVNVPEEYLRKYFVKLDDENYQVTQRLKSRVNFRFHNLLTDRFDTNHDLIICRNVVIYFELDVKEKLYERFANSLRPGGIIFIGSTERIFNYKKIGLELIEPFFYRKVG